QSGKSSGAAGLAVLLGAERTGTGEVAREIDFYAVAVAAEMKGQFPFEAPDAEHVGQATPDAALPGILFQRLE
ncbi:MAG TPA: hypothetical protein VMS17_05640, partial [Gemmataceae bacterium]|nr:hypothetical protein [Gemmataceae bacterium]